LSRILDFYRGELRHPSGVTIESIWGWSHDRLEHEHTYIQWLFPLRDPSRAVPGSPTITETEVREFNRDPALRDRVLRSFRLMLGFYGFTMGPAADAAGGVTIAPAPDSAVLSRSWLTPGNHNHLRITRILKSLCILGLRREAREWFAALQRVFVEHADTIGSVTYDFWRKAVE
jgi:hypothetical protein